MDCLNKFDGNWVLVFYKLLHDALFLLLIAFGGLLLADGILPGFIDPYLSLTKMVLVIFAICAAIFHIHKHKKLPVNESFKNKKMLIGLIVFLTALIVNSLLRFDPWEILIITTATLLILFYLFKVIFE
jgi:hypothetical protein